MNTQKPTKPPLATIYISNREVRDYATKEWLSHGLQPTNISNADYIAPRTLESGIHEKAMHNFMIDTVGKRHPEITFSYLKRLNKKR